MSYKENTLLLAKPDVALLDHLSEVAKIADHICSYIGLDDILRKKVILAAALHDIGKFIKEFQDRIYGRDKKFYPHALASFPIALVFEKNINTDKHEKNIGFVASYSVLTHHSPLGPDLYKTYSNVNFNYCEEKLVYIVSEVYKLLLNFGIQIGHDLNRLLEEVQKIIKINPVDILNQIRRDLKSIDPIEAAIVKGIMQLSDFLSSSGKQKTLKIFLHNGNKIVKSYAESYQLNNFQKLAMELHDKDFLCIRAPTGSGKTLAFLLWSMNDHKILILLPTQATVNSMYKRLKEIFGEERLGISHGNLSYVLSQQEGDEYDNRTFHRIFAKPVTVSTLDQYLLSTLRIKYWEIKLFLFMNSSVIVDEVHAYEPFTLGLLIASLRKFPPKKLAIASATLPEALLRLFPNYEKMVIVEADNDLWDMKRHYLNLIKDDDILEHGVDLAIDYAQKNKKVLVIMNTVEGAQKFYQKLKEKYAGIDKMLLHSRFILRDRKYKEDIINSVASPLILISTQIVEVSLDISYDVLITEICPIDALVQRMGRVNRKGTNGLSPVHIYTNYTKSSAKVYGEFILNRSREILESMPDVPSNKMLSEAVDKLYNEVIQTEEWQEEFKKGLQTVEKINEMLGTYTLNLHDKDMAKYLNTRSGNISLDVLPEKFYDEAIDMYKNKKLQNLTELLVPVPIWWKNKYCEHFEKIKELDLFKVSFHYDSEMGLINTAKK